MILLVFTQVVAALFVHHAWPSAAFIRVKRTYFAPTVVSSRRLIKYSAHPCLPVPSLVSFNGGLCYGAACLRPSLPSSFSRSDLLIRKRGRGLEDDLTATVLHSFVRLAHVSFCRRYCRCRCCLARCLFFLVGVAAAATFLDCCYCCSL